MTELLQIKSVTKRFGGSGRQQRYFFFSVNEHEILSVIGPNGAGKSTLFKLIASFMSPTVAVRCCLRASVFQISAPHIVARKGVVRTFQETTIFKGMSVRQNVIIAHHLRSKASLLGYFMRFRSLRDSDERQFGESADEIIESVSALRAISR